MLNHNLRLTLTVLLALVLTGVANAAPTQLKAVRFSGVLYVAVRDIAACYELGASLTTQPDRASYRTALAQFTADHDSREIVINGVTHWLSAPVLDTRGQLWIASLDVLKVIDPVLRQGRFPGKTPVRTVMLDPGHGGSDRGARGVTGREKELTLDLAKRVQRLLEAAGLKVVQTRVTDENVSLDERVVLAEHKHADLFVSLHFNSGGNAQGIETYCVPPAGAVSTANPFRRFFGGDDDKCAGNQFDEKNVWLAHCVQRSLLHITGANDRGIRRARFVVIRDVRCPAILVESGFLSNPVEEQRLLATDYRDKLAKGIADGILEYRTTTE
ncbi:MAG: N-acetylmuramoyl-L-alanine amidase [Verrucomicrobiota bacterium]